MGHVKMFDNSVIKGKIIQADQLIEKFSDKNQIINIRNGSDIGVIGDKMDGAATPLEGARSVARDGKTFIKNVPLSLSSTLMMIVYVNDQQTLQIGRLVN